MNIVIIPGFTGYPEEKTFEDLDVELTVAGHNIIKIAWPYFPEDLRKYSLSETLQYTRSVVSELDPHQTVILGFSMGGIVACFVAKEFKPKKLGLIVTPSQAGSADDLSGKYKNWMDNGYRDLTSSKFGKLRIPFSFIQDAQQYNVLDVISEINCPVMFIAGEDDSRVPVEICRRIYDKANHPKFWHEISKMEHKYQYQTEKLVAVNRIIQQFIG
ncbi:MAG: hypothetical protein OHK0017_13010 [Patescibacteria group bacterium]